MAQGFLKVKGTSIVDENEKVVPLRGTALGGWLNMENFMTGYPGHESGFHAALTEVLGKEKYEAFHERFLEEFFTEKDAAFLKSIGMNTLRLPFNHRHFEDDMNPRVLREKGVRHLDRVIRLCSDQGIYTILDMHTVPGCQGPDQHSDNNTSYAAFWDFKDHQDRAVWLWEQLAERYKDNPWIAGYNPLNEPCDPQHVRLPAFYERVGKAIRAIDPNHILWLDGNTFAMEWKGFETLNETNMPNCVYSIHDYSKMGFPLGTQYDSSLAANQKLEAQFLRKCEFQHKHKLPIWVGEFGPTYASKELDPDFEKTNKGRYKLLAAQLSLYEKYGVPWSTWCYKDIGMLGAVSTSESSPWNKLIAPFNAKKVQVQVDGFLRAQSQEVEELLAPLVEWIDKMSPNATKMYPSNWRTIDHVKRNVLQTFLASSFLQEYAELFRGKSEAELDELARSFSFENCVPRKELTDLIAKTLADSR
ncbi:glucanase [Byssothecium circinans]|uniref:Glucanase n=1 Tax=Byssothecium circinans TaxID=147558 RepID=A0A6A5TYC6_9PLEO|nr:glucanase [Byssothecium circinans]